MALETDWFVNRDNKKWGPYPWSQICEMAQNGQVDRSDQLWHSQHPNFVVAGQVEGLFETNSFSPAIEKDNFMLSSNETSGRIIFDKGKNFYDGDQFEDAVTVFLEAIRLVPNNSEYYAWLSRAYNSLENYTKAMESANRAIQLDRNNSLAYRQRGYIFEQQEQYLDAVREYSKAIELDPKDKTAFYRRGFVHDDLGDYVKALQDFSKAIQLDPQYDYAFYWRGFVYARQENWPRALKDFSKAIQLDPEWTQAYISRGGCYYEQRDFSNAIIDYTKAIQLNPKNAEVYRRRGHAYLDQQNISNALQDYSSALTIDPQDLASLMGRGVAYASQGDFQTSIKNFSSVIAVNSKHVQAHNLRGDAQMELGNYTEGLHNYRKALELDPGNQEIMDAIETAQKISTGEFRPVASPSQESIEIFYQAIEILEKAGTSLNDLQRRDVISLLSLATQKAEAPFPRAYALLAMIYVEMENGESHAQKYANIALEQDSNEFRAQYVKMQISASKVETLQMNPRGLIPRGIGAKYIFEVGGKLLKGAFDASKTTLTQSRFKAETENLLAIFRNVCREQMDASEFLYFAQQLMAVADLILETKLSLPGGNPPICAAIANAPHSNVVYEDTEEQQEVSRIRRLAEGRINLK